MSKGQTRKPSRDINGGKGKNKGKGAYLANDASRRGGGSSKSLRGTSQCYGAGNGAKGSWNDNGAQGARGTGSRGGAKSGKAAKGANKRAFDSRSGFREDTGASRGKGKGSSYKKDSRSGIDAIAGKHAVIEALEAGVPLKKIMIAQGISSGDALDKIQELADLRGVDIDTVPRVRIEEKAAGLNHQGILAIASAYRYSSIHEITESCDGESAALVIVLDHITDVGNFGAVVRTAEVLGASGVVIANKRSVDVVSSTYKTSAGAVSRIKIAKVTNIANTCDALRESGFWIAGASEKASCACWDSPLHGKIALVMGNEQTGISKLVQQKCDFMVKLEQRGQIGSLNVSCAAAALGYEWLRQCAAEGLLD